MSTATLHRSRIDADQWEPFLVDGTACGEVHWIRTEAAGYPLFVGLWRSEVQSFPYVFSGDETVHALEGEVVIDLEGGPSVTLGPGDIASFPKGARSTWTITKPFKKLFSITG